MATGVNNENFEVSAPEEAAMLRPMLVKKTMTPREAAQYCGFGVAATYKLLADGIMPCIRVGSRYYIPHVALDRWLESEPFNRVRERLVLLGSAEKK